MSKLGKERYKRRRAQLYAQNPYCPACGCKMVLPDYIKWGKRKSHDPLPDNAATIDHINSRLLGNRQIAEAGTEATRLMCNKCNNERQRRETLHLPIEEIWRRSGKYPRFFWRRWRKKIAWRGKRRSEENRK